MSFQTKRYCRRETRQANDNQLIAAQTAFPPIPPRLEVNCKWHTHLSDLVWSSPPPPRFEKGDYLSAPFRLLLSPSDVALTLIRRSTGLGCCCTFGDGASVPSSQSPVPGDVSRTTQRVGAGCGLRTKSGKHSRACFALTGRGAKILWDFQRSILTLLSRSSVKAIKAKL